ncbi:MAG: DUF4180 domain-containing protein [Eubacteriales bacterium]|nr:DUF4180 domain-containing protein [Eubacteriales bacterium]
MIPYGVRLANYSDLSRSASRPFQDFMYESNCGGPMPFAATAEDAEQRLCRA